VVHIIAISGMHLALIYVMLVWVFGKIPGINKSKLVQVILILACLWLFSLLTGASASVIRAAVMFTFITIGTNLQKKSSIYNSLAASAFVMLCYNPFYLWDVGFQLSYLAVVGIIIFQKPIYNWMYVKNKYVNDVWKLTAVSLAAQTLTFPICIYYFHQFPNFFLITNIIAVPLSSVILYAEIGLVALFWIPFVGSYLGKAVAWLVWLMNEVILKINALPYTVWDKIPASVLSTILLYATVFGISYWLLHKNLKLFKFAIVCLLAFTIVQSYGNWQIKNQQKLIVYNVPQHQAIDFVVGNNFRFVGDSILLKDGMLQNFHLKPGRIALQLNNRKDTVEGLFQQNQFYQFGDKKVVVIDQALAFETPAKKIDVDIIVISKSPKLYIPQLANVFNCKQYVFDASNSLWKIGKWKQDCDKLNLHYHSIPEKGAFLLDL
jgi:competence protein ComEC